MRLPPPLRQLYDLWMRFSHALGSVMSFLILTILWVVGFGIYALITRFGRVFGGKAQQGTYWLDVINGPEESYRNQF